MQSGYVISIIGRENYCLYNNSQTLKHSMRLFEAILKTSPAVTTLISIISSNVNDRIKMKCKVQNNFKSLPAFYNTENY